jgi:hypothetical protein
MCLLNMNFLFRNRWIYHPQTLMSCNDLAVTHYVRWVLCCALILTQHNRQGLDSSLPLAHYVGWVSSLTLRDSADTLPNLRDTDVTSLSLAYYVGWVSLPHPKGSADNLPNIRPAQWTWLVSPLPFMLGESLA